MEEPYEVIASALCLAGTVDTNSMCSGVLGDKSQDLSKVWRELL